MTFTAEQKRDCLLREIRMRERVYPRWVAAGKMSQRKADEEIAIIRDIAADYSERAQSERLI